MTIGTTVFLDYPAGLVIGYTSDDAAAMAWLRQHASSGEVLVNDGFADADIWAPFKSGVPILNPRAGLTAGDQRSRELVSGNVAHLDRSPQTAAAACAVNATYVYRGARASEWDARTFPPLVELRASSALVEVFNSGEAVVFRTRLSARALVGPA